jgi:hypothetical protein
MTDRNRTMPGDVYIVQVEHRIDGLYAFTSEAEAERFIRALLETESEAEMIRLPLNLNGEHTDTLIEAEHESLS